MLPFVLALCAIVAQIVAPHFAHQGLDLIDSFFQYALLSQFTHLSWTHLALNLAAMAVLTWGFSPWCSARAQACALLWAMLWVAFYLTWIEPLTWYCGLSGALHGSLTACLVWALKRLSAEQATHPARWTLCAMAIGLIAKLTWEWYVGHSGFNATLGGPIAFEAHRGGALGGLILGLLPWPSKRQQHTHHRQRQ